MTTQKSTVDPLRYVGGTPVQAFQIEGTENLSVSGVSVASTTLANRCLIVIVPTTWVHMARGSTPTATSADAIIPPGSVTPWIIDPGDEVAFIKVAGFADGLVSVIRVTEIIHP